MRIGVLVNRNSRKNRARGDRASRLEGILGDTGMVRETSDSSEVRGAVGSFVDAGCDCWISDGGDGTLHWMLNEGRQLLQERGLWNDAAGLPLVMPTNGGTIDFVARKAGIKGRCEGIVQQICGIVRQGGTLPVAELNSLEVEGWRPGDPDDAPSVRKIGFAVAIGGIGQKFFRKYYENPDPGAWTIIEIAMKGGIGYLGEQGLLRRVPLVSESIRHCGRWLLSGTLAKVSVDGRAYGTRLWQGLHIGAVDIDFGTMRMFPFAGEPGRLHMVVGDMPPSECAWKWTYLVAGRPIPGDRWDEFPGEEMVVDSVAREMLDPVIDGEPYEGFRRLRVRPGPRIRVPVVSAHGASGPLGPRILRGFAKAILGPHS